MFRMFVLFLFKQKTAYEMRMSDWSSDVCSSDLATAAERADENRLKQALRLDRFGQLVQLGRIELAAGLALVGYDGRNGDRLHPLPRRLRRLDGLHLAQQRRKPPSQSSGPLHSRCSCHVFPSHAARALPSSRPMISRARPI